MHVTKDQGRVRQSERMRNTLAERVVIPAFTAAALCCAYLQVVMDPSRGQEDTAAWRLHRDVGRQASLGLAQLEAARKPDSQDSTTRLGG